MKGLTIDWATPVFPAVCLTLMTVTAYGGLRGSNLHGLVSAALWLYMGWADYYLSGEKEKGLPRKSFLTKLPWDQ